MSPREVIYLWLNCEGWVRFGPFQSLWFEDTPLRICDQDSNVIAEFDGSDWLTTHEQHRNVRWRSPMITASSRHPHPNHG
jgi:hypothetical protein